MVGHGLTAADAGRRRVVTGPNEIPAPPGFSVLASIGSQMRESLIVVLLVASVLTLLTGDLADTVVIAVVVVVNTAVGVIQELRAEHAVTALSLSRLSLRRGTPTRVPMMLARFRLSGRPRRCTGGSQVGLASFRMCWLFVAR